MRQLPCFVIRNAQLLLERVNARLEIRYLLRKLLNLLISPIQLFCILLETVTQRHSHLR